MASALRAPATRLTLLASSPVTAAPLLGPRRIPRLPRNLHPPTTPAFSSILNTIITTARQPSTRYFSTTNSKMVKEIHNKAEFETAINAEGNKLVLVDYHAVWCGPCRMIAPKIQSFSSEFTDVDFYKLDVDEVADVAAEQGIRAMPTFKLYKNGEVVKEVVGANPAAILEAIKAHK